MKKEDLKVGVYFRYTKEYQHECKFVSKGLWKVVEGINPGNINILCIVSGGGVLVNHEPFRPITFGWWRENIVEIVPYNEVVQLMLEI
jgi:hypothetical protein